MNERMIELYKEACEFAYDVCAKEGRKGGTSDHIWNTLSTGKFAELIVRECAKVCSEQRNPANLNYKPSEQFAEAVKQHFGVY